MLYPSFCSTPSITFTTRAHLFRHFLFDLREIIFDVLWQFEEVSGLMEAVFHGVLIHSMIGQVGKAPGGQSLGQI